MRAFHEPVINVEFGKVAGWKPATQQTGSLRKKAGQPGVISENPPGLVRFKG